jgi:hypothetical protein
MAIKKCTCDNEYQDKKYGYKMRVHNPTLKGWRCTVCSNDILKSKKETIIG